MSKKITAAIAVLVVLAGVLLWQSSAEDALDQQAPSLSVSLPEIDASKVDGLTIVSPSKGEVVLTKTDAGWKLQKPIEFDAAESAVDAVLEKLGDLQVVGVAATRADNHDRLDVTEEKAVKVSVLAGGATVADLRIGVYRSGNTMVREAGEDLVAAVSGSIRFAFEKELKDWRDREVHTMDVAKVASIRFDNEKGSVLLEKNADGFIQSRTQEPQIEEFDPVKAKSIVGTACSLRAVDFADDKGPGDVGLAPEPKATVTITTTDDPPQTIALHVGDKADNAYYARRADAPTVYKLSAFMGDRMTAGPADFVKEEPKPVDEEALKAAGAQLPGKGANELPPEVMQQIQQQLKAQGVRPQ